MSELVAWLREQLDDDERAAASLIGLGGLAPSDPLLLQTEYLARWTPKRALAEVDAKRRMLDWCDRMELVDGFGGLMARDARMFRRLLALPYADRAGYREEWRP